MSRGPALDMYPRGPLDGVLYYLLPDLEWQYFPGHRLDFGLELRFSDGLFAVTWDRRTGELDLASVGLAGRLVEPHALDAIGFDPWRRLVGQRPAHVSLRRPGVVGWTGSDGPSAVCIRFDGGESVWVVAGNYLDDVEGLDEADRLVPYGDEIIVVDDPDVAERLGITAWPSADGD